MDSKDAILDQLDREQVAELTTRVVAAYVGRNETHSSEIVSLISEVGGVIADLIGGGEKEPELIPAVDPKRSVKEDYIVCLEDGAKLKMLKRYLRTNFDMTPEEYRARWGLPANYPMVAPGYSKVRQRLAKQIGLGRKPGSGK
jgi:predicted transcriptional regulator